jgi:hypothetical protein
MRERRLRDVKLLRRTGEVAMADYRLGVHQLSQLHLDSS